VSDYVHEKMSLFNRKASISHMSDDFQHESDNDQETAGGYTGEWGPSPSVKCSSFYLCTHFMLLSQTIRGELWAVDSTAILRFMLSIQFFHLNLTRLLNINVAEPDPGSGVF
jgi:hypothetical protein